MATVGERILGLQTLVNQYQQMMLDPRTSQQNKYAIYQTIVSYQQEIARLQKEAEIQQRMQQRALQYHRAQLHRRAQAQQRQQVQQYEYGHRQQQADKLRTERRVRKLESKRLPGCYYDMASLYRQASDERQRELEKRISALQNPDSTAARFDRLDAKGHKDEAVKACRQAHAKFEGCAAQANYQALGFDPDAGAQVRKLVDDHRGICREI